MIAMKKLLAFVPVCAILLFSAACSTQNVPAVRYTLSARAPAKGVEAEIVPAVKFTRITVPAYIDTQQIVTRKSENSVLVSNSQRWAEPLAYAIQRLIPAQVSQLLCGKTLSPFESVSVFIDRLDGKLGGDSVQISAQIVIARIREASLENKSFIFAQSVPATRPESASADARYAAYAQSLSQAIFKLSETIAAALEKPESAR